MVPLKHIYDKKLLGNKLPKRQTEQSSTNCSNVRFLIQHKRFKQQACVFSVISGDRGVDASQKD